MESGRSVGPIRRPGDRRIDTSPYSSGNGTHLNLPNDLNWRRTSSDSAIHQSLTQNTVRKCVFTNDKIYSIFHYITVFVPQDHHHSHGSHSPIPSSPNAQRRITNTSSNIDIKSYANDHGNNFALGLADNRPRSSCGIGIK